MSSARVHVVAAALRDSQGRILIQRRPPGAHLGGLWEFPGGKLEPGESREAGLQRELHEELGIVAEVMTPLISIPHDYPDKRVLLDVWTVERWSGEVHGREGQPVEWVAPSQLHRFDFPAADRPVLSALTLPALMLVTPTAGAGTPEWMQRLRTALTDDVRLAQVRVPGMGEGGLLELARRVVAQAMCDVPEVRVLVNAAPSLAVAAGAHGAHLDSRRLWQLRARPALECVGASCHDAADLARAAALDLDYALLGPVAPTTTHPGAVTLGWGGFERMVAGARLPVYALGGLGRGDVAEARRRGGQGIAAIGGLWSGSSR